MYVDGIQHVIHLNLEPKLEWISINLFKRWQYYLKENEKKKFVYIK